MPDEESSGKDRDLQKGDEGHDPVAPGEAERRFGAIKDAAAELELLNEILRAPGSWLDRLELARPGGDREEAFKALMDRKGELEKVVAENAPALADSPDAKSVSFGPARSSTFSRLPRPLAALVEPERRGSIDPAQVQSLVQPTADPGCPSISYGQVTASGFRAYDWNNMDVNGARGAIAFWPLSSAPQLPNSTVNSGWVGDSGGNFWGWAEVPGNWWPFIDPVDSISQAAVLQFTLPPPPCDVECRWVTLARAEAPTPWFFDANLGRINTDWIQRARPDGGGFPGSVVSDFSWFASGLFESTSQPGSTTKLDEFPLGGWFDVKAGTSPKIYLGCALMVTAQDGEASTIKVGGIGDYFEFRTALGGGVFYVYVGPPSEGGGGCFLTTACVEYAGLPGDCWELRMMRRLRDEYVTTIPGGKALIVEYYEKAPAIVSAIRSDPEEAEILGRLLNRTRAIARMVEDEQWQQALKKSRDEFSRLKVRYLP